MKLAICNQIFREWPVDRAFAFAAECGYTGVEIAPITLHDDIRQFTIQQRAAVRQQAAAAGLEVVGLHQFLTHTTGYHLTSSDADVRRRTADYLGDLARLNRDLGGSTIVLGSPRQRQLAPDVTVDQGIRYTAEVLESCLPVLEETGVTVAVEPLGPAEGNFLNTAADAVRLIETVGSPYVRLLLDCKAMASEESPAADLIRRHAQLLVHVHANDPNRQGPGFGTLDFVPILTALGEIDYCGWVSVEVFDLSPGIERLTRESSDYLRDCLVQIAEN